MSIIVKITSKPYLSIGYNYISRVSASRFKEIGSPLNLVLVVEEITIHEERADVVRSIFEYYLAGASLGKIVDMLFSKGIFSPTGNPKWTRAAVDNLLANKKHVPIVGIEVYLDAQFERDYRCNVDYDKVGHPRKTAKYQSLSFEMK